MTFQFAEGCRLRVALATWLSSLACALFVAAAAHAHEVQPAVADVTLEGDRLEMALVGSLEPWIAGVDLDGLANTNASAQAEEVDRLRALAPEALAEAFRDFWPAMAERIAVTSGGAAVALSLDGVDVPEVGDVEQPRLSRLRLSAELPPGDAPVTVGWTADLGDLVVRQMLAGPDGYTAFLPAGTESAPIPRTGGVAQTWAEALWSYVPVGFDHIVPKGLDHILFVLGLFFLSTRLAPLLWQVTAFTAAHTVTLAVASLGIFTLPGSVVEPLIAASIVYVGVENVLSRGMAPWRPVVVFAFGLLHGLGFASVLAEFGLGRDNFVAKLVGFNIGVELGQLAVIAAAFLLVGLWFGRKPWYKTYIANPASIAIALIGAYWVLERTVL
ncbi:HupE/UreJ family protein [Rhodobacteraceae bacterium CCMM004]|nr:HupE/UreJ family protein [Rhodobacteraceae bacterium CCMM004]